MNLENIKMLRELHQLLQAGIITESDFVAKKKEILSSQNAMTQDEKINMLKELHQLSQEGIIAPDEFEIKKQELLNAASATIADAPNQKQEEQKTSSTEHSSKSNSGSSGIFNSGAEKTRHELNVDGLSMKLTNEKLYVNSATSNETFGLRSVNGIGIVDLVDRYNPELTKFKNGKNAGLGCGGIIAFFGIVLLFSGTTSLLYGLFMIGLSIVTYFLMMNLQKEPILMSAVRVMLNGMNRDFEFNKKSEKAQEVAKFVALVEDTLTAYHKSN